MKVPLWMKVVLVLAALELTHVAGVAVSTYVGERSSHTDSGCPVR